MDKEYYVIVFTDNEGKINYCQTDSFTGYPYASIYFDLSTTYPSKESAQKDIDTWEKFNRWNPHEGFTLENIKIKKLTCSFGDC